MTECIEFKQIIITDPETKRERDAVEVTRNGQHVALLPEADRLRRALSLTPGEIEDIVNNFAVIMNRQPTRDESEFWQAVLDFQHSQG